MTDRSNTVEPVELHDHRCRRAILELAEAMGLGDCRASIDRCDRKALWQAATRIETHSMRYLVFEGVDVTLSRAAREKIGWRSDFHDGIAISMARHIERLRRNLQRARTVAHQTEMMRAGVQHGSSIPYKTRQ